MKTTDRQKIALLNILIDREGFFQNRLKALQNRLRELGARKIRRNGDWYWDLKPDLTPDEVVIL